MPQPIPEGFELAESPVPEGFEVVDSPSEKPETTIGERATAFKRGADLGLSKAKIGVANLVLDTLESAGVDVTKAKEAMDFAFELSKDVTPEIPGTETQRDVGEFIGENSPFMLLPGGAGSTMARTIVKSSAIGSGVGAAQFVDEGESRTRNVLMGGFVGAVSPVAFKALEGAVSKVIGNNVPVFKESGELTDEAIARLREVGETPENVISLEVERLKRSGVMTPEEAERFNLFKSEGIAPTRAEVTQRADDFQFQQEQGKTSGPIRDRLNDANQAILNKGDELSRSTGIETESAFSTGQSVLGAIDQKALAVDDTINGIYKQAREAAGEAKNIRLGRLVEGLRKELPLSESRGNIAKSVTNLLKENGVIGDGFKVQARMDANQAEEVRKLLNKLSGENPKQSGLVRELKEALDLDVAEVVGRDAFVDARKAYSAFRKDIERLKRTKFDKNTKSTVLDLLEGRINEDQVFERIVLQKSTSRADVAKLKQFLTTGEGSEGGKQAWNNLRGETMRWVFNNSASGKNDIGSPILSSAKFDKSLERIGDQKLGLLFNKEELNTVRQLQKILKLKEPVNATALGKGPSAQAISALTKRFPLLGDFLQGVGSGRTAFRARKAVEPEAATAKALEQTLTLPRPVGVAAAGATGEEF